MAFYPDYLVKLFQYINKFLKYTSKKSFKRKLDPKFWKIINLKIKPKLLQKKFEKHAKLLNTNKLIK